MNADEVHAVLDALADAGCVAWVSGGWGVDALAGRQTRPHRDLDLAFPAEMESVALETLARRGYRIETDWRPIRVEVAGPRGRVDLHPVAFDADGHGVQQGPDGTVFHYPRECLVSGVISGRRVGCLSVAQQLLFHSGYPLRDVDHLDLAVLGELNLSYPAGTTAGMDVRVAAKRWADAWAAGWPARDVEVIAALQGEDADHWASMFRRYRGRDGLRSYLAECFGDETRPAEVWFGEPRVDGDTAAVEYWAVTYPHGEPLTITGCTVLRFTEDGLVAEARDYSHVRPERVLPPDGMFRR